MALWYKGECVPTSDQVSLFLSFPSSDIKQIIEDTNTIAKSKAEMEQRKNICELTVKFNWHWLQ